jgi:hypothetical protein
MRSFLRSALIFAVLVLLTSNLWAQVQTGAENFPGSFIRFGPASVNLATLGIWERPFSVNPGGACHLLIRWNTTACFGPSLGACEVGKAGALRQS